jgi:aminomethyltransferase
MPLWYKAALPEHLATRKAAGLFDVTHMGRVMIEGPEASQFLDYILPTRIKRLENNAGVYSVFCTETGGIVDDLTVCRVSDSSFYMVYNASNREKDFAWMKQHIGKFNAEIKDISDSTPMFAVQGPAAIEILGKLTQADLGALPKFWLARTKLGGHEVLATRSGYTGEDGMEIALLGTTLDEAPKAVDLWEQILAKGKAAGIVPVGLAARDTLRLEAGMPLYGNDIHEETSPLQARLSFVVHLKKDSFLGKDALVAEKAAKPKRYRVGLIMLEKGIPRPGFKISAKGEEVGEITSGSISPLLRKGIALGYVARPYRKTETLVHVQLGKRHRWAEVVHPKKMLAKIKKLASK